MDHRVKPGGDEKQGEAKCGNRRRLRRGNAVSEKAPDCAALHPGYACIIVACHSLELTDVKNMDYSNPPDRYWHCMVALADEKEYSVVNDLSFDELQKKIVGLWIGGKPFAVAGTIVRSYEKVKKIKITHTDLPKKYYADCHDSEMRASGIADMATDRRMIPISQGTDATYDLLFSGPISSPEEPEENLIVRLMQTYRTIGQNSRRSIQKGQKGF